MKYTFQRDDSLLSVSRRDYVMQDEDGAIVGRIIDNDDYFVGHFKAIPLWWPVSHPEIEGAKRCMVNVASMLQVQERICV